MSDHGQVVLTDTKKNFYIIKDGYGLNVEKKTQTSPSDEMKDPGTGNFITAYINHGVSPKNASYEYMMLVRPSTKEVKSYSKKTPYEVIVADNSAHVVKDVPTGITAYVIYTVYSSTSTLVNSADAETIVMERTREDKSIVMSVCTPDLGIVEKAYTTPDPGKVLSKKVVLNGTYSLAEANPAVTLSHEAGKTIIVAACQHGQPVEFILNNN